MARDLFTIPPTSLPAGQTISPKVSLNKQFNNVVAIMDVPSPDATLQFTLIVELSMDNGTTWPIQLFTSTGTATMLDPNGNILPSYEWTFRLSGPSGIIPFDRLNNYRARIILNKAATLGFRIGGDS